MKRIKPKKERQIVEMIKNGSTYAEIIKKHCISSGSITNIKIRNGLEIIKNKEEGCPKMLSNRDKASIIRKFSIYSNYDTNEAVKDVFNAKK